MLILIIECSSEKGCLVLAKNNQVLASKLLPGGPALSQNIAQEVKALIESRTPDLVAVGIGPGSYTGIRVGVALAKALSYGWKVPCLGFCSLKAFGPPPVLVDARQGGIYALIDKKAVLMPPEELTTLPLIRSPHPETLQKRIQSKAIFEICDPDPAHLAQVVWDQFLEAGTPNFVIDYCGSP